MLIGGLGNARGVGAAGALFILLSACGGPAPSATSPSTHAAAATSSAPATSPSTSTSRAPLTGTIVYGRHDGDSVSIFTAQPDGSGVKPLLAGSSGEPRQWSPDGTMLTVIPTNRDPLVGSVVRGDGTHQRFFRLPPGAPASLPCGIWSPDAKRLACEGFDDARPLVDGVYTVDSSDGLHLVQLTKHRDVPCSYSPDGTRILFVRVKAGNEERNQLMTVHVDGSNEHLVTKNLVGLSCDWSPDGKTILSEMDGSLILIDSLGTPTPVPLDTAGSAGRGAFSPDGSHIIFSFAVGARTDIYTVRTDGSDLTQITDTPANEEFGDWGR